MWTFFRDFFALLGRGRVWSRWRPIQRSQILKKGDTPVEHRIGPAVVGSLSSASLAGTTLKVCFLHLDRHWVG